MTVPKPKTDELTNLVNLELFKPRSDELVLKRLEREAGALLKSSDSEIRNSALMALGMVRSLAFDLDGAKQYFEQALAATGNAPMAYHNYAAMLGSMGRFDEALHVAETGLKKAPADPGLLRLALKLASDVFEIEKAEEFSRRLQNLELFDEDMQNLRAIESVAWQKLLLTTPEVSRDAVLRRYLAARAVAFSHRVRVQEERTSQSVRGILIEWLVDCDDEEIAKMNYDVAIALSRFECDPSEQLISFGFSPSTEKVALPA